MAILRSSQWLNQLSKFTRIGLVGTVAACFTSPSIADVHKQTFGISNGYLKVEVLDDDLLHVEYGTGNWPANDSAITTTPMIFKHDYQGPDSINASNSQLETDDLVVNINAQGCLTIFDKQANRDLTTLCPESLSASQKKLTMKQNSLNQVYGLGQKLTDIYQSDANGDWARRGGFSTGGNFGHSFSGLTMNDGQYAGGASGQLQFPIMYAAGSNGENIALLMDNQYKQNWSLSGSWWNVTMYGQLRFYVMTGDSLLDLRKDYMELTGTPPVPPKKAFGLWVSEFGYENWNEVDDTLGTLRNSDFPVDGFVLDLLWFGGYYKNSPDTPMGRLSWDEGRFPNPSNKIASYKNDNIGLIAIEESYVGRNSDTFSGMNNQGYMTKFCNSNDPVIINDWIGKVGMVDWSNPNAGAWWHDQRRKPNLTDKGIIGHWTDLGEPEKYNSNACYSGVNGDHSHGAVHNLYNLFWTESIYNGYVRNHASSPQRPFSLTRAGTVGTHRFGAAMWSGDIGGRLDNMAASLNAQMHMSFAGIDYYGSDIGGFWRSQTSGDTNAPNGSSEGEMYTLWFANSAWFDVPVRPHGMAYEAFGDVAPECPASCNNETSPALMGNRNSNLMNIRQRYELTPYYYSLAHRAYLSGEPVIAPLVMYYQDDVNVKGLGNEKLVGENLLVAMAYKQQVGTRDVYLPAGTWIDFHTNRWIDSAGEWLNGESIWIAEQNRNRLPAYAKAGAIIPKMYVDSKTKDVFGNRKDGSSRNELILNVYADENASEFTLYEDDGANVESYDSHNRPLYASRAILLTQQINGDLIEVTINAAQGHYAGGVAERNNEVRLITRDKTASQVFVNGSVINQLAKDAFYANNAQQGWYQESANELRIRTGVQGVNNTTTVVAYTGAGSVPPVANAGNDIEVNMTLAFQFDGSGSSDVNNDIASYQWTSVAFASDLSGESPSYAFDAAGVYTVLLTVTDAEGNTDTDAVIVTVIDPNAPVAPNANAGSAQTVNINTLVTFDGRSSTDNNDDIISYTWSNAAFGGDLSTATPTFSFSVPGLYDISLLVSDSTGLSDTDTVTITVIDPMACDYRFDNVYLRGTSNFWAAAPMGKVGNCTWTIEQTFSGAVDDRFKFDIKADWKENYGDDGANSSLELFGADIFVTEGAGTYIIEMNDEAMTYNIKKKPAGPEAPVAVAGSDMSVVLGTSVSFNASASTDANNDIESYNWSNADFIDDLSGVAPTHTFSAIGQYVVNLTVMDSSGLMSSDSVVVTVTDPNACDHQFAHVYLRGTSNAWAASPMTQIGNCSWEIEQEFDGSALARFKFDINADWSQNYGDTDANGSLALAGADIFIAQSAGKYIITMNDKLMSYTVAKKPVGPVAPLANAGNDITVKVGSDFTLDASASTDQDGSISLYSWDNGLGEGQAVTANFADEGVYSITLTVTDNDGLTASDEVVVTVVGNQAPVAIAGPDQTVTIGTSVSLDASGSFDPDGQIITYSWEALADNAIVTTTLNTAGVYLFSVTVIDDEGARALDTVQITVLENQAPIADAGLDITVTQGQTVNFDGSGSRDADGSIVSYSWDNGLSGVSADLVYGLAGVYTVTLTVTDNNGLTSSDTVTVTVEALPVGIEVSFTCNNGITTPGQSIYVVGDSAELGNWTVASSAQQLSPTAYPTWTGTLTLPVNSTVKWKCVVANESSLAISRWQGGSDNQVVTGSSGTASSSGRF